MSAQLKDWQADIRGTSWFFGIGINEYLHFPNLYNAVRDVQDIKELLVRKYDVEEAHCITLFNEEATEDKIKGRLEALTRQLRPHDKLLIYYSGHGHLSPSKRGYWISHDALRGNPSRYISNADIRMYLEDSPAKHILLISDSCFSGSLFHTGAMRSTRSIDELEKRHSRWGLCSGRSEEEVMDGEPGTNSPFATSILEALESNDIEAWNVSRLVEIVTEQTAAHSQQLPQGSPLAIHGHKGGQYVFRAKGSMAAERREPAQTTDSTSGHPATAEVTDHTTVESKDKKHQGWSLEDGKLKWSTTRETTIKRGAERSFTRVIEGDQLKRMTRLVVWIFAGVGLLVTAIIVLPGIFGGGPVEPLQMQYEVHADGIIVNFAGGQTPYDLKIAKESEMFFGGSIETPGEFGITYDEFFAYPGNYDLLVTDAVGDEVTRQFTIAQPDDILVNTLHTTSSVNTETLWPVDREKVFAPDQPVYLYMSIQTAIDQDIVIKWYDEESNMLFAPEIRSVPASPEEALRVVTYQQIRNPGGYVVIIEHYSGIVLDNTAFGIKSDE